MWARERQLFPRQPREHAFARATGPPRGCARGRPPPPPSGGQAPRSTRDASPGVGSRVRPPPNGALPGVREDSRSPSPPRTAPDPPRPSPRGSRGPQFEAARDRARTCVRRTSGRCRRDRESAPRRLQRSGARPGRARCRIIGNVSTLQAISWFPGDQPSMT